MHALILKMKPGKPEKRKIGLAAGAIRRGGLVVFPTETVYGIGANALDGNACRKIYAAKGRPSDNPLIVHVSDIGMAEGIADIPSRYRKAIRKIWPAPITFILKAKKALPKVVTSGLDTVAVRMPEDRIALSLIKESGVPIAAPSANISKKPSSTSGRHAIDSFKDSVDVIIDAGRSKYGMESTILDLRSFTLLRPGAFTVEEIEKAFGKEPKVPEEAYGTREARKAISPGMKYRHYSPDTPLFLFKGNPVALAKILSGWKGRFAFIGSRETAAALTGTSKKNIILGRRGDSKTIARNMFAGLIELDRLGVEFGVSESFAEKAYGLALMNRLRKASNQSTFSDLKEFRSLLKRAGLS